MEHSRSRRAYAPVIERELPCSPRSVAEARRALEELAPDVGKSTLDDLRLLLSEVVSNVIKHGELDPYERFNVRAFIKDDGVRVEVSQPGPPLRLVRAGDERLRESGWGLLLLDVLTRRWGVSTNPTTVWFETPGRA